MRCAAAWTLVTVENALQMRKRLPRDKLAKCCSPIVTVLSLSFLLLLLNLANYVAATAAAADVDFEVNNKNFLAFALRVDDRHDSHAFQL